MLIQFAVENFLSFQGKTVLNLTATADPMHPSHLRPVNKAGNLQAVRCAAVYGANASGKSNLVKALAFAEQLVTKGTRPGASIGVTPFRLQQPVQPDARFEFEIWAEQTRYSYGFVVSSTEVRQEWLYRTQEADEELCFEREAAPGKTVHIKLGEVFGPEAARVRFVADGTRPEQLFLTEAEERNVAALSPLSNWFRHKLIIITPESIYRGFPALLEAAPHLRSFASKYLAEAGTGITALITRRTSADYLPKSKTKQLQESLKIDPSAVVVAPNRAGFVSIVPGQQEHASDEIRVLTQRTLTSGQTIEFELEEESDGTRRLLDLVPVLFAFLGTDPTKDGGVLLLDELERSLHPLLARKFLQDALASTTNSQLLFTTHDTNLLDLDLLRADEIWFAEKGPDHASKLYSLAEFKEEQLQHLGSHLEKGYLNGRFGAIPFLGQPRQLGLERKE
ncbi:MAG: AAA family ATPase [Deltaproteobacteria bacterium]|nr:AAA family ATPase [Deltaproteobacteria bacterium]